MTGLQHFDKEQNGNPQSHVSSPFLIPWGSFRGRQEEKWGSFRGQFRDHFRDHFGVGIICVKMAWSEHLDCGVNIR